MDLVHSFASTQAHISTSQVDDNAPSFEDSWSLTSLFATPLCEAIDASKPLNHP